ncbi:uncharacterized protein LOC121371970 [Gigantopelta aegis]|uniref:uncharacterized protein LOC121371970 n=1 Tax=Gigantopelta aegis TaxID=1735272 RepID=UPI001B88C552|nr:uncharacterized protein LOC121371970 [Gigantopelta aegis]
MKVYVWMPTNELVGHASLELSDGTYISWWPDEDKNKSLPMVTMKGHASSSLEEDIDGEGRQPTHEFTLKKKYDERKMKKWWDKFKYEGWYVLTGSNCCWVVYKALTEGGAPSEFHTIWKPVNIRDYAAKL